MSALNKRIVLNFYSIIGVILHLMTIHQTKVGIDMREVIIMAAYI